MSIVTCSQLVAAIVNRPSQFKSRWVSLQTFNDADLKGGKKCPFYGAKKYSQSLVYVGLDNYRRLLENERRKAGMEPLAADWQAEPINYGSHVPGTPFIVHTPKGESERKLYLRVCFRTYRVLRYVDCNGATIDHAAIAEWLNVKTRKPGTVPLANYMLQSIVSIKMDGLDRMVVDHADAAQTALMF